MDPECIKGVLMKKACKQKKQHLGVYFSKREQDDGSTGVMKMCCVRCVLWRILPVKFCENSLTAHQAPSLMVTKPTHLCAQQQKTLLNSYLISLTPLV
jgi:hypothetical protein